MTQIEDPTRRERLRRRRPALDHDQAALTPPTLSKLLGREVT